ncbi:hypothetical protein GOP47_0009288 [Adiantum capillus-veneris]|uniref:Uncharacterized protein n=1 Tax=Adiantum capillus-veneris TaxID=13818 RepID=A0A9D4UWT4_ADICA|nr:hypothetical protein GOP47_0009288 [Adiantum capillus-veneris]
MGCSTSKPVIETTDDVLRNCKVRRSHIREAIKYRKEFAVAHAAYVHSLKDVGFAFKCFAGGEFSDIDASSLPSSTPVLALPPPSSPSLADLSPPRQSGLNAPTLSPPHSLSRENRDVPSKLPPEISISPPLSPMRLPTSDNHSIPLRLTSNQSSSPLDSPSASPHNARPLVKTAVIPLRAHALHSSVVPRRAQSFNHMVSPDRGSDFSPPYYSPSRDDLDDALVAYSPPPPSSLITDTTWFSFENFMPPSIPRHLQEQRRKRRVSDSEQEDLRGARNVEEVEEEIPELEEPDHRDEGFVHDARDTEPTNDKDISPTDDSDATPASEKDELLKDTPPEEVEKRVVSDETVDNSESRINQDEAVGDNVPSLPNEPVSLQPLGGSGAPKKTTGPAVLLKEKTLAEAMQYIDEFCVRAYHCGRDVSSMLETQMHYQPKANGMKDSLKAFNSVTSHWSRKTPSFVMGDSDEGDDVLECGMAGSHASTLERLYAWERKLHHEVKEGRLLRMAFDQKFKELHILNAKGGDQINRDKLKATIKKLDMRLLVAIRAISAASSRIQELANDELYPQLLEMLGGLTSMWRIMAQCHQTQTAIALELRNLEGLVLESEATESHKRATAKLKHELEKLQTHLQSWIWSQKKYINELNEWIRRCYKIREPSKESAKLDKKVSSDWTEKAPIFQLLRAWRGSIVDLSPDIYVNGIKRFVAAIRALEEHQLIELKSKMQAEKSTKRLGRQTLFLDKLEREYTEIKGANLTFSPSRLLRLPSARKIPEKRARLDKYKTQVETEKHVYFTAAQARKNTTVDLLQQQLPSLFESWSSFAEDAEKMYEKVREMAEAGDTPNKQNGPVARLIWEEQ